MSRDEAEKLYVAWILEKGNPAYFVWKAVSGWDNEELATQMAPCFGGEEPEIEDEE